MHDDWTLGMAKEVKTIKLLAYERTDELSLLDYLSSLSDLAFSTHASEMRYGETHYFRGVGKNVKVVIVPTITLSGLPRRYRKKHWYFVEIYCHPDDKRFDILPGCKTVSADQYDL